MLNQLVIFMDIATFINISSSHLMQLKKDKAIPVTGCEGQEGCEMTRLPHFLDNWLTNGSEVVSLTRWPPFTPRKIPGTHIC
jgi:hypothetical protein